MKDLTPRHLTCGIGLCPALFQLDDGRVVVIGKKPIEADQLPADISIKIGKNETAVILPPEYLKGLDL